jgi:hypothetical protein
MDSSNRATWSDPDTWVKGRRGRVRPTRGRIIVLIGLFVLAIFAARSCQQSQIRITKEQAIAIAERQVDFSPGSTQIRLLRQGLNRKPFWFVSMSDPVGSATNPKGFRRLVLVEIDANTGKVENVDNQIPGTPARPKQSGQAPAGSKGGQH